MKKGDKWNWALVAMGLGVVTMVLYVQYLEILFAWRGGYHNLPHVAAGMGIMGILMLLCIGLLVMAGIAAACSKTVVPLIGTVIGVILQLPSVLLVSLLTSWVPLSSTIISVIQVILGCALVAAGIARRPRTGKVQQSSSRDTLKATPEV